MTYGRYNDTSTLFNVACAKTEEREQNLYVDKPSSLIINKKSKIERGVQNEVYR